MSPSPSSTCQNTLLRKIGQLIKKLILILKYKIDDIIKCHWMKFIHPIVQIENDV